MTDTPSNYGYAPGGMIQRACLRCGATVADTDLHDAFHEGLAGLVKIVIGDTDDVPVP
jgi:hypothetical protein